MRDGYAIKTESRLDVFSDILGVISCDFVGLRGLDEFVNSYMYLTVKNKIVSPECYFNRSGYHIDGYGIDDINYVWSDSCPTEFNFGEFNLSEDDDTSLLEMDSQARESNIHTYDNNTLLRLDSTVVHKVAKPLSISPRCFLKVSFSKSQYNLSGNSHNYLFDYNWEMKERKIERNQPNV